MSILPEFVQRARIETPALPQLIHFNNAGASLMPKPVLDEMVRYLQLESQMGGYEAAEHEVDSIGQFYDHFGLLLNVSPNEIAFIENASRAWQLALYAIDLQPGDEVLVGAVEYVANFLTLKRLSVAKRVVINPIPLNSEGHLDLELLEARITPRSRLICLTHLAAFGGCIQPAEAVGALAEQYGLLYFLDICQSVGQRAIDIKQLKCHVAIGTGRKFLRGPRGSGFLYVNQRLLNRFNPLFVDLQSAHLTISDSYQWRSDAKRFESWERSFACQIGLSSAVKYCLSMGVNTHAIEVRVAELSKSLCQQLSSHFFDIEYVQANCHDSGIVSFCLPDSLTSASSMSQVVARLRQSHHINISIIQQLQWSIESPKESLKESPNRSREVFRASIHYYNTQQEIEQFCFSLKQLIRSSSP